LLFLCSSFALPLLYRSQHAWKAAHEAGLFDAEMAPIEVKVKRKLIEFAHDEHARYAYETLNIIKGFIS
jgi:acetyl-CoA acyltransferase 2